MTNLLKEEKKPRLLQLSSTFQRYIVTLLIKKTKIKWFHYKERHLFHIYKRQRKKNCFCKFSHKFRQSLGFYFSAQLSNKMRKLSKSKIARIDKL